MTACLGCSALHTWMYAVPFPQPEAGPHLTAHQSVGPELAEHIVYWSAGCNMTVRFEAHHVQTILKQQYVCSAAVMQAVLPAAWFEAPLAGMQIVAYDFGCKHNILRRLASFGCKVTVVPSNYPAAKVLELQPDGIFLSNGPVCIYTASAPVYACHVTLLDVHRLSTQHYSRLCT